MLAWRVRLKSLEGVAPDLAAAVRAAAERQDGIAISGDDTAAPYDPVIAVFAGDIEGASSFLATQRTGLSRIILAAPGLSAWEDAKLLRLFAQGADEVLDIAPDLLPAGLAELQQSLHRWWTVDETLASSRVQTRLVGRSRRWQRALRSLVQASLFGEQPVLLAGETGTGKEAAARLIHDLDTRRKGEFVAVDCASVVETLSASELFGHKRGAFTGADRDRVGAIARADGGTLFLDEIGELKLPLQAELLRVLQEGTFKPVGDDCSRRSSFRVVAATNRDLRRMVAEGRFRSDLYYRIAAVTCHLPPLRERPSDAGVLLEHFLRQHFPAGAPRIDERLRRIIESSQFPGNVRQLRNLSVALAANYDGGALRVAHLPASLHSELAVLPNEWERDLRASIARAVQAGTSLDALVEKTKRIACESALELEGSARKAASRIGVSTRMVEKRRLARCRLASGQPGAASADELEITAASTRASA